MSNLFILLIVYLVFFLLALLVTRWNISSPSILFFGSFCVMLALANIFQWYFDYKIKNETFWIFFTAGALFLVTEFGYKVLKRKVHIVMSYTKGGSIEYDRAMHPIMISKGVQCFIVVFMLLVVVAAYYRIIISTSAGTWGERVRQFEISRQTLDFLSTTPVLDFCIEQATRIGKALVHVIIYLIIYNNLIFGIRFWQQKMLIVASALYVPATLFQGVRLPAVEVVMYCIIIYVLLQRDTKKRIKVLKLGIVILLLAVGFIFVFTVAASITGDKAIERNAMQYVATYLCGGLKNFDELIVGKPCSTKYFGQSSFCHFYKFLIQKFHVLPPQEDLSYHSFGFFKDNTITIFGRWYEDFGTVGVLLMTLIVSLIFSWLHEKAMLKQTPNVLQIIYAQQVMALVWASYDDRFASLVSPSNIIMIIIIALFYRMFIGGGKYRITFGGKRFCFRKKADNI